jgi:hypothetical protein
MESREVVKIRSNMRYPFKFSFFRQGAILPSMPGSRKELPGMTVCRP